MPATITERIKVIDVDTHITEPADVWTARVSKKWGDKIPHVEENPEDGKWYWMLGGKRGQQHPVMASAGWKEPYPSFPPSIEDVDPASFRRTIVLSAWMSTACTPRSSTPTWADLDLGASWTSTSRSCNWIVCAPTTISSRNGAAWIQSGSCRSVPCRSGTWIRRSRRSIAAPRWGTAGSSSRTSRTPTVSPPSAIRTGTASGRPRRSGVCRSTSTSPQVTRAFCRAAMRAFRRSPGSPWRR